MPRLTPTLESKSSGLISSFARLYTLWRILTGENQARVKVTERGFGNAFKATG